MQQPLEKYIKTLSERILILEKAVDFLLQELKEKKDNSV
jgi:hypothetical protein